MGRRTTRSERSDFVTAEIVSDRYNPNRMVTRIIAPLLALLAMGCAAPGAGTATNPVESGTEPVLLTVEPRSEWRVMWIEGDTDLPDGALVNYRATHELARSAPAEDWPATNLIDSGRATVQGGHYWARVNTLNWPAGEVAVLVQFPLPPQPPEVDAKYGEFGERLTGENVTDLGGMKAIEVESRFEHTR